MKGVNLFPSVAVAILLALTFPYVRARRFPNHH